MRGRETVAMNNALAKAAELHDMLARDHALLGRLRFPPPTAQVAVKEQRSLSEELLYAFGYAGSRK